jgi:hypothetical protein
MSCYDNVVVVVFVVFVVAVVVVVMMDGAAVFLVPHQVYLSIKARFHLHPHGPHDHDHFPNPICAPLLLVDVFVVSPNHQSSSVPHPSIFHIATSVLYSQDRRFLPRYNVDVDHDHVHFPTFLSFPTIDFLIFFSVHVSESPSFHYYCSDCCRYNVHVDVDVDVDECCCEIWM